LILSQFINAEKKHSAYRQQGNDIQKKSIGSGLWEDLHHGMFFASPAFAEKIKKRHLADAPNAEIPAQKHLNKDIDSDAVIVQAANFLNCDPQRY
jgi:hypothetical protein